MAEKDFRVPVFRRAVRGYAPEHVDAFIKVVREKYNSLVAENEKLKGRISSITAETKKRGVEDEMRRHEIEEIGEKTERLLSEARERADRLVREAEAEAESIRADAACERADADIYAEEAKTEALEMLKERDALLSCAKAVVSEFREKLGEECGRVLCALEELDGTAAAEDAAAPIPDDVIPEAAPEEKIAEEIVPASAGPEPENAVFLSERPEETADDAEEDVNEATDEERVPEEENFDDITIPDFSPVFEDEEEPEETVIREGFPFAFDESDYYLEDGVPGEEDVQSEEDEEDGIAEEYEEYGEDEDDEEEDEEEEDEDEDEDEEFSDSIPDYINEYPEGEPSGILEDENKFAPEEPEGPVEQEEQEEPEEGDAGDTDPDAADFDTASSETYRDYDLDEILRGLEYMAAEKTEEAFGTADALPDDADIVDALKKKFGDVPDGDDLSGEEKEDVSAESDFYEDEEHEDGENFDPNNFLRFRK